METHTRRMLRLKLRGITRIFQRAWLRRGLFVFGMLAVLVVGLFYAYPTRAVPGDHALYRESIAEEVIGVTPTVMDFGVTEAEGTPFSIDGNDERVTLADAGHYLVLYNLSFESTSGSNRSEVQGQLELDGWDMPYGNGTCYIRRANAVDECWLGAAAIIESTTTDQTIAVKAYLTDSNSAGVRRRANESSLTLVRLDEVWSFARVRASAAQTFNGTTDVWSTVAWDVEDEEDAVFSNSNGTITLADAGRYLVTSNLHFVDSARRTMATRLTLNGYELPGTRVTGYTRGTNGAANHAASFVGVIEATTTNQVLRLEGACVADDCGGVSTDETLSGFTITRLPDTVEMVRLTDGGGDQLVDGALIPVEWDTQLEVNAASFSHSTTTDSSRVTIEGAGDYLFFGSFYADRDGSTETTRQQPHWEWRDDTGGVLPYGSFAKYNRGALGGNWSSGASGAVLVPSMAADDFIELVNTDESDSTDVANVFVAERIGLQGLRLGSFVQPDVTLSQRGTQVSTSSIPASDLYLGGTFVLAPTYGDETVTSITIREQGTVDAAAALETVRLYYETDSTAPHNCASETYGGAEAQFGATSTFPSANGSITFSDSVAIGTSSPLCVYVVLDVSEQGYDGETIEVDIADADADVVLSDGPVGPEDATIALAGTTALEDDEVTLTHYHWRDDTGDEGDSVTGADSLTGGVEDTVLSGISVGTRARLRVQIANVGSLTSGTVSARLEYGLRDTTCEAISSWTDVGAVGGAWDMSDSPNLNNGDSTTNIAVSKGGTTDEGSNFITPNGAVRDTSSQTGSAPFASGDFVEVEYAIEPTAGAGDGVSYCFRTTTGGTPYANYDVYPAATIAADVLVSATGTPPALIAAGGKDVYAGGVFVINDESASRTVDSITITESGTIDAANNLANIRLHYDLDTTAPYNCLSESFASSDARFGATSTAFSGVNGTSTFSGSVAISTTSAMCVYPVLDVAFDAEADETIELTINNAGNDVVVSGGSVNPNFPLGFGSSTVAKAQFEQSHYHWRGDDGTEAGASSVTDGSEDTPLTLVSQAETERLRLAVPNIGATTSTSTVFTLQYTENAGLCSASGGWQDVGSPGALWITSPTNNLVDGEDTTNIDIADGGVTDADTQILSPNSGVRDLAATSSPVVLDADEFVELEYAIEATNATPYGTTYCFRLLANGAPMDNYAVYPQATMRPNQDFYIQRGDFIMGSTTQTLTAGVDYVAPTASTSAFIRITNSQHTGAGREVLGGTQDGNTVTTHILDPWNIEDSVTFTRANDALNTYVAWEIIEYTGPRGGDNEIKVHAQQTLEMASGNSTGSFSVSGVEDDGDVVVFITGQSHPSTGSGLFNTQLATADWLSGTDEAELTREDSGGDAAWSVAVVEFTGANWRTQRVEHVFTAVDVEQPETITTVNDIDRAFLHTQKRSSNQSLASHGHTVYFFNASTLYFFLDDEASGTNVSVAWVIENTQTDGLPMQVHRSQGTQSGGSEAYVELVNIGTTTRDITTTSIFLNNVSSGGGTAFPRTMIGATLVSTSQYQIWVSDTGQTRRYRTEIVEWPTAELSLAQNYYRFYADNDALTPADAWPPGATALGENTSITVDDRPIGGGDVLRIRLSVAVAGANLSRDTKRFKLQYGVRDSTCGAISTWSDLAPSSSSSAPWRGYNTSIADGTDLSGDPPTGGDLLLSVSDRAGSLEESNPTATNTHKVLIGEDVEFDWVVEANQVTEQATYCFRMVEESGVPLQGYNYYPTVRTSGYLVEQFSWQWFGDETSLTPSVSLAASNTAPSNVAYEDPLKLRVVLAETAGKDGADTKFKLQWSDSSDFATVQDVEDIDSCAPGTPWCYFDGVGVDNATITEKILDDADACAGGVGDGCGTHNELSYAPSVLGEVGTSSTDSTGTTINLQHTYTDPVFIVESVSGDALGGAANDPAAAIITATTTSSFTVRIQEPDNEADDHGVEEFAYIVMERGAHTLPDGRRVDVGTLDTTAYYGNAVAGGSSDNCTFTQSFDHTPAIYTALQTNNNTGTPDFLTVSQTVVTASGFLCSIEVPDGESNAPGSGETIGWIAIEQGAFTNNSIDIVASTTAQSVNGWSDTPWYTYSFPENYFSKVPGILASKQTRVGAEGGWARFDTVSSESVQLAIDERDDGERTHASEALGLLAISEGGVLYDDEGVSGVTFTAGTNREFEFTIVHAGAAPNTTYFFRLYDYSTDAAVPLNGSSTNPSLSTEGTQLTFSIAGYAASTTVEGVQTVATTTATSVPFGVLPLGIDRVAAQQLTVSTNATQGYQVLALERGDLAAASGATIQDVTGTNASPVPWSSGCSIAADSCFGYHVGDNTLSGGSTRFLSNDTYAALTTTPSEVAYSSTPVVSESTDIVYRIQANPGQSAGQYESKVVFVVVPVY